MFFQLHKSSFFVKILIETDNILMMDFHKNTWKLSNKQLIVTAIINLLHFFTIRKV